jgi:hypothetical protein
VPMPSRSPKVSASPDTSADTISREPRSQTGVREGYAAVATEGLTPTFLTGVNAEPVIYRDVSLSTCDLLAGSIQLEKTDASAKATLALFKLKENIPVLSEFGLNRDFHFGIPRLGTSSGPNRPTVIDPLLMGCSVLHSSQTWLGSTSRSSTPPVMAPRGATGRRTTALAAIARTRSRSLWCGGPPFG